MIHVYIQPHTHPVKLKGSNLLLCYGYRYALLWRRLADLTQTIHHHLGAICELRWVAWVVIRRFCRVEADEFSVVDADLDSHTQSVALATRDRAVAETMLGAIQWHQYSHSSRC